MDTPYAILYCGPIALPLPRFSSCPPSSPVSISYQQLGARRRDVIMDGASTRCSVKTNPPLPGPSRSSSFPIASDSAFYDIPEPLDRLLCAPLSREHLLIVNMAMRSVGENFTVRNANPFAAISILPLYVSFNNSLRTPLDRQTSIYAGR